MKKYKNANRESNIGIMDSILSCQVYSNNGIENLSKERVTNQLSFSP
jgi:hypothetical protein